MPIFIMLIKVKYNLVNLKARLSAYLHLYFFHNYYFIYAFRNSISVLPRSALAPAVVRHDGYVAWFHSGIHDVCRSNTGCL